MRTLKLCNYDIVPKEEATLKVVLFLDEDGNEPAPIYLRGKVGTRAQVVSLKDIVDGTVKQWTPTTKVDINGTPEEYNKVVDWWFEEARKDETFRDYINTNFAGLDNLSGEINKAKSWLKLHSRDQSLKGTPISRKESIGRYLKSWLNRILRQTKRG